MLDRDNAVFSIPKLQFPSRKLVGQHTKETLVDGVCVRIDKQNVRCNAIIVGDGV